MNKKRVAVERGFCEKDFLSELYCESDIFKWSDRVGGCQWNTLGEPVNLGMIL